MGRLTVLVLAFSMLLVTPNFVQGVPVGMNYSRMSRQILLPSIAVEMILANGIQKIRLHSFYRGVVQAFSNSKLEMMLTIPNVELNQVDEPAKADAYADINITKPYKQYDLNVKYLMVGNEPYTIVDNYTAKYQHGLDSYIASLSKAVLKQPDPYNKVKISTTHGPEVLISNISKPSDADFTDEIKDRMLRLLKTLDTYEAPFVINVYPHLALVEKGFPLEFAFFDNSTKFKIMDGRHVYTNIFDFIYDSYASALQRYGYDNMEIIVAQVGWPTDGHFYANVTTAQRFYEGFLRKMANDEGTPLRPGPLNAYLWNLNDENNRDIKTRGPTIRHYGIYDYKGQPKFNLDLTLRGRKDVQMAQANGVVFMPKRYCVVRNESITPNNRQLLMEQFDYACQNTDCSKLFYGSSYNNLTFEGNLSYAFNNYFQVHFQKEEECDFKGVAKIVVDDPSPFYGCYFPLQFLSTVFAWGQTEMGSTLAATGANALQFNAVERLSVASGVTVFVPLICLFFLVIRL